MSVVALRWGRRALLWRRTADDAASAAARGRAAAPACAARATARTPDTITRSAAPCIGDALRTRGAHVNKSPSGLHAAARAAATGAGGAASRDRDRPTRSPSHRDRDAAPAKVTVTPSPIMRRRRRRRGGESPTTSRARRPLRAQPTMSTEVLESASSATLDQQAAELASFVVRANEALYSSLSALAGEGRFAELVSALGAQHVDVFRNFNDDDVEGIFTLMLSLLKNSPVAERATVVVDVAQDLQISGFGAAFAVASCC